MKGYDSGNMAPPSRTRWSPGPPGSALCPGPILIVDDDPDIRSFVEQVLADEGYAVATAGDGLSALETATGRSPQLILLDMRMPGMDGWTFAETYRAQPGPHAPIVVMTAARNAAEQRRTVDIPPAPADQRSRSTHLNV